MAIMRCSRHIFYSFVIFRLREMEMRIHICLNGFFYALKKIKYYRGNKIMYTQCFVLDKHMYVGENRERIVFYFLQAVSYFLKKKECYARRILYMLNVFKSTLFFLLASNSVCCSWNTFRIVYASNFCVRLRYFLWIMHW